MTRTRRLALALGLNVVLVAAQVVFGLAGHSLGLLADAGHNLSDVAAVAVSLVAVQWARRAPTAERSYGYHRGTILAALANAATILTVKLVRQAADVLLESTPGDVDLDRLTAAMSGVEGVENVHDLHVWSLSSDVRALSAHLVLAGHPSLEEAQAVGERVKDAVGEPFSIVHSTLELECEPCTDGRCDPCGIDGGLAADPARRSSAG